MIFAKNKSKVVPLRDKTFKEFNINIDELKFKSHKKIYVQCQRCNEIFLREYQHIHQLHACPTHVVRNDGTKLKWCNKCGQFLTYTLFGKNAARHDGLNSVCKVCANTMPAAKRKCVRMKKERLTVNGWLKWIIKSKRSECKKKGMPFDIDEDYLNSQYQQQNGRCVYSGILLEFWTNSQRSASLERIDSSRGYIRGNVVLASKIMNWAKNVTKVDDFIKILDEISDFVKDRPVRLEFKKLHKDAILPMRSRTTDAGYDVSSIEDISIEPNKMVNVNTGLIICAPPGYYVTLDGRSSLWMKGIIPSRGIIDATFNGPLMVALTNGSDIPYFIKKGDRIAQILLHRVINVDFSEVNEFTPVENGRNNAGFGSSGR